MSFDYKKQEDEYKRLPAIFLVGKRFGRLVVTGKAPMRYDADGRSRSMLIAKCDCGSIVNITSKSLRSRNTQSCGCLKKDLLSNRMTTHGLSSSRTYKIWRAMNRRCSAKSGKSFDNYVMRGITVCSRWRESFDNFLADMGVAPDGLSIDRINNDGNYEPSNCRWATPTIQARNTRQNHLLTINGITKCSTELAHEYGINPRTVKKRITGLGWNPIQALTESTEKTGKPKRKDIYV